MKQLHPLQLQMLQKLLFSPVLRYSDLRPSPETENSNKLDFHLDKLIAAGYVEKTADGYGLTDSGKEYANQIDTANTLIQKQGKLSALVACVRGTGTERELLFYTRLKQPFYGCQGFLSGKIRYGETVLEAAERELFEETGLTGTAEIAGLIHYRVIDKASGRLVEDKYMFQCRVLDPSGTLIEKCEEGEYMWVPESQIEQRITNPFEPMDDFRRQIALITGYAGSPAILEVEHVSEQF